MSPPPILISARPKGFTLLSGQRLEMRLRRLPRNRRKVPVPAAVVNNARPKDNRRAGSCIV